jgi:hypothetical protein
MLRDLFSAFIDETHAQLADCRAELRACAIDYVLYGDDDNATVIEHLDDMAKVVGSIENKIVEMEEARARRQGAFVAHQRAKALMAMDEARAGWLRSTEAAIRRQGIHAHRRAERARLEDRVDEARLQFATKNRAESVGRHIQGWLADIDVPHGFRS